MSSNIAIQYTVVVLLILAAIGRIIWNIHRRRKGRLPPGCCGCSLAETCNKPKKRARHE